MQWCIVHHVLTPRTCRGSASSAPAQEPQECEEFVPWFSSLLRKEIKPKIF